MDQKWVDYASYDLTPLDHTQFDYIVHSASQASRVGMESILSYHGKMQPRHPEAQDFIKERSLDYRIEQRNRTSRIGALLQIERKLVFIQARLSIKDFIEYQLRFG